jgi:hypothetical protein
MFCGSSLALVAVLAMIINNRGKRARAAELAAMPITVAHANVGNAPPSGGSGGDLPDLDSLLNVDPSSSAPRPMQRGTFMLKTTPGENVEAVEVMTILRDVAEGGLIVQIGDKVYRNPPALADAEFKRRFNSTVRDLFKSIGDTSLSTRATGEITAVDEEAPAPPPLAPPPILPGSPAPGDLPKFKVPDFQEKPKRRKGPADEIPEINIAGAIEEYLQYKLSMTTQFARRFIHVRPSVGGGLRIDVDDKSYETVGDVEDEAVRLFLQATIEEWQSRQ